MRLSDEQQVMISLAKDGYNVLVDACIGSGKTTSIQELCNAMPDKRILYLTYNRLLKIDAKEKITDRNVFVQNYHGFAFVTLSQANIKCGIGDLVKFFNEKKPDFGHYDILVLDEYQDIEQELADMLWLIKERNPYIQIIAVGDMCQKIYDKTTLNVPEFIDEFLDDYEPIHFTRCFRLNKELAASLGRIWGKPIRGVNENCTVKYMNMREIGDYLATKRAEDILCLGSRTGDMSETLNYLEKKHSHKFNKETVYASIKDEDRGSVRPDRKAAIFTTYDSSKGLERPICVVFDYTKDYWGIRLNSDGVNPEVMRNIFCVAASRGKQEIIFVIPRSKSRKVLLTENDIIKSMTIAKSEKKEKSYIKPFYVSEMFDFKYKEDVEACYNLLSIEKIPMKDTSVISVKNNDGHIDLSPCIGIYQEANFFEDYDIEDAIHYAQHMHGNRVFPHRKPKENMQEKILYLTMCETTQDRYFHQVDAPFIKDATSKLIMQRLSTVFKPDEVIQQPCGYEFFGKNGDRHIIDGRLDVLKDGVVYELKFVNEIEHTHCLQAAVYGVMLGLKKTRVWNTKKNEMLEIVVPSKKKFMNAVINCITKGAIDKDYRR